MKILVAESAGFSDRALNLLQALGSVSLKECAVDDLAHDVGDCHVLWVRLRHAIGADVMDAAPSLRWIVSPTTGLNHIDLDAAESRGVRILSLKGEVDFLKEIRATAELTIGLMLALLRHIPNAAADVLAGHWNRDRFQGRELYGCRIGLVGFGRLGRIVARYLGAFDSRVSVCDPHVKDANMDEVTWLPLHELLRGSDIVSLHASYAPDAARFFNAACFDQMPRGAYFINTARGELVDEGALLDALKSGKLAGAALDVLSEETALLFQAHPLIEFARTSNRLLITPHIGGCTAESMERAEFFMARRLREALGCVGS